MSDGPKFSGPAREVFRDILDEGPTTIERILGRRVSASTMPAGEPSPLTGPQQQAMKEWAALAGAGPAGACCDGCVFFVERAHQPFRNFNIHRSAALNRAVNTTGRCAKASPHAPRIVAALGACKLFHADSAQQRWNEEHAA